jgi:Fe-S-cluster-containing dehydrogenase component
MGKYSLLVDIEKCVGCQICEVACKQANNLPAGPRLIRVITVGPVMVGGKLRMDFVPMRCMHCGKPTCIDACPTGAITKRTDGIVVIDEATCTGCKLCIEACPFGAIKFNDEKNVAMKCTLCADRLDRGQQPMCVIHCPAQAIRVGDINRLTEAIQQRKAKEMCHIDEIHNRNL